LLLDACGGARATKEIDLILADYAEFLQAEGLPDLAMKYLKDSSGQTPQALSMADRIFYSHPQL